jgi:uncharacterized Fe-S cluster-containing radical SAM superfamily enzyme
MLCLIRSRVVGVEREPIKKTSEVVEKLGTTILPLLATTDKAFTCNQKESRDQERDKGEVVNIYVLAGGVWRGENISSDRKRLFHDVR